MSLAERHRLRSHQWGWLQAYGADLEALLLARPQGYCSWRGWAGAQELAARSLLAALQAKTGLAVAERQLYSAMEAKLSLPVLVAHPGMLPAVPLPAAPPY